MYNQLTSKFNRKLFQTKCICGKSQIFARTSTAASRDIIKLDPYKVKERYILRFLDDIFATKYRIPEQTEDSTCEGKSPRKHTRATREIGDGGKLVKPFR